MHTITLKSDDNFYNTLNGMVKTLNTTKSELIRKSVLYYQKVLEKEKLKQQIKSASYKVRKESLSISKEFDSSLDDGLKNV
ncbi:MAG: DNA-binding protein [Campylobacterota bacterium]|nr:DNA-binding protein [Campylobacterota bacterium]